jgi:hypothetical protein
VATDLSFKVAKRRREPITFDLEGSDHVYTFDAPKQAFLVLPMIGAEDDLNAAKAAFEWLDKGLSEEDRAHLEARFRDPEDDLDVDVLEDVIEKLVERAGGGRPTT